MGTKYHIIPKSGNVRVCQATKGKCPFGGAEEHYSSRVAAQNAFEKSMEALPKAKSQNDSSGHKAIYDNYRASIRAQRQADSGRGRTGTRKQRAREQISERYHVPISVVKNIVREYDERNGVTHEHDSGYLKDLEFVRQAEALIAAHGEDNKVCPKCGNTPTEEGDVVRVRANPYDAEIHGEYHPMLSCFNCYLEISYDI